MRDHRHEPGRGTLVDSHDGAGHHAQRAVGKTTRVEQLAGPEPIADASASRTKHTREDVRGAFRDAVAGSGFLFNERRHAIDELRTQLNEHAPRYIDNNILAHLAKVALGVVGNAIQAKIAKAVVKGAAGLAKKYLDDTSSHHVSSDLHGGPIESFIQMHLLALDLGERSATRQLSHAETHLLNEVNAGDITTDTAFDRAHSLKNEIDALGPEAFQLQYNASLSKWFSALAQTSFGKEPGGASDVDGHLSTQPVAGGNKNYPVNKDKQGIVHLQIKLSYTHAMGVELFSTPGIEPNTWLYTRKAGDTALGDIPLNDLPGHQHIPVIADVTFVLKARSPGVMEHLPNLSDGEFLQPVAISWNERNLVHTELPAADQFERLIVGKDRTWLSQQVGHSVHRKDHVEAGVVIMREKIGRLTIRQLSAKPTLSEPER